MFLARWIDYILGWRRLNICRHDLVLDVGGGDRPLARADIVCDKYLLDSTERAGSKALIDRPFVVGDASCLPFQNGSVDYVFVSHVLEHLEDPEAFFLEAMRVGKKGCIVAPSALGEKLISWSGHKWFISVDDGYRIMLRRKPGPKFDADLALLPDIFWKKEGRPLRRFIESYRPLLEIEYEWEGSINYRVIGDFHDPKDRKRFLWSNSDMNRVGDNGRSIREVVRHWGMSVTGKCLRFVFSDRRRLQLLEILACPICKGCVRQEKEKIHCVGCGANFPIWHGVPVMLSERASSSEGGEI